MPFGPTREAGTSLRGLQAEGRRMVVKGTPRCSARSSFATSISMSFKPGGDLLAAWGACSGDAGLMHSSPLSEPQIIAFGLDVTKHDQE